MFDEAKSNRLLNVAKTRLWLKGNMGFLGTILCGMQFYWDETVETAETNGMWLKWNPHHFSFLDPETRITVLAHELWHPAYMHNLMSRIGNRDLEVWNWAADHVVNIGLCKAGFYMGGWDYLMDMKYDGWSTEEVYDDLIQNMPPPPPQSGGGGSDQGKADESKEESDGQSGGSGADNGAGGSGGFDPSNLNMSKDVIPMDSEKESQFMHKMISAAHQARMSGQAGSIPGETEMVIDKFLNPTLPWERITQNWMNELHEPEYSYRRPSRRHVDPVVPGLVPMSGLEHIVAYLDISGSITDQQVIRFNSEFKGLKDMFNPKRITLITFDEIIQDTFEFTDEEEFEKVVVHGRGGTNFYPVMEHAKKLNPTAMLMFTDMHVQSIPPDPKIPLVWLCVDKKRKSVPYGKLITMND